MEESVSGAGNWSKRRANLFRFRNSFDRNDERALQKALDFEDVLGPKSH